MKWIEINLPWSYVDSEYPDTQDKFLEHFGKSHNEVLPADWIKWENELPEVIEWHQKCEELFFWAKTNTFVGLGLNKLGTLIELEDGRFHLIGTIDTTGSFTLEGFDAFRSDVIVKRYAVLCSAEMLTADGPFPWSEDFK